MTKFDVLYDGDTMVRLDTRGNYSIKRSGSSDGGRKRKGNLLLEKDFTLYLNRDIPIRIYAELPKEKV